MQNDLPQTPQELEGQQVFGIADKASIDSRMANQYLPVDTAGTFGTVVFKTPKRVDIISDGAPHRTELWQNKFPITFEYIATPKISPYVYLKAVGVNKMSIPILRGNLSVFMGADFICNSYTTGVLPEE